MIVVHLPTGRKDGQSFSELRLETPAHHGLATSANLGSLYRPERTAGMDQAPLFEYPLFPPPPPGGIPNAGSCPVVHRRKSCRMSKSSPAI